MIPGALNTMMMSGDNTFPFSAVQLLTHLDGTNGSTTFVDESDFARTLSVVGAGTLTTTDPKFGTACFDGTTGTYLRTPKFSLSTGDFTIEMWFKSQASSPDGAGAIFGCTNNTTGNIALLLSASGGSLAFQPIQDSVTGQFTNDVTSFNLLNNTWRHIAVCRKAGVTRIFIDGQLLPTTSSYSYDVNDTTGFWEFSSCNARSTGATTAVTARKLLCFLDDIRIIKDYGIYDSTFTPPVLAFPDD